MWPPLLRLPWKQWAHECLLVTEHAPAFISYPVGRDELGIRAEQGTVLLVCGEAGETEQRECLAAGAFGWQEVAMVSAAVQIDQFHPAPGKAFEGVDPGGIDHVFNDTGDHSLQASPVRSSAESGVGQPCRLSAWPNTDQPFGRGTGGHARDRVAAHIGGSRRSSDSQH